MNFCHSLFQIPGKTLAEKVFLGSLLLLIVIIPFDQGGNGYILQFITHLLLLLCATVWAMQTIRRGTFTLIIDRIDWFVLGFLLWSLVAILTSPYKYVTMLEVIKILTYTALFYLCRMLFPLQKNHKTLLLGAVFGSSLLQFLIALYSAIVLHNPKLQASFVNPNNLACFWVFGIAIALSVVLFSHALPPFIKGLKKSPLTPLWKRGGLNGCTLARVCGKFALSLVVFCLAVAILSLKSRGAMISVAGTGIFLTTLKKRTWGICFLVLLVLLLALPTPWGSGIQRLRKLDDPYAYQRIGIWKSSVRMIVDHPVFGVGPGMYRYYGRVYNFPLEHQVARYAKMPNVAHNDLLQIGAELGLIGMLFALGAIVRLVCSGVTQLKQRPVSWQIAAGSAGLLGLLIQGIFSHLLASPAIATIAIVLSAILVDSAGKCRQRTCSLFSVHRNTFRRWPWYAALCLLFAGVFIFIIYFPTIAHIHYLRFRDYVERQDYAAAVHHLTTAIRYVPIHAYYHHDLGTLYATAFQNRPDDKAFQKGSQEFTEAIRLNPINYEHALSLAELYAAMFQHAPDNTPAARDALRLYGRALQYNPFDPFIRYSMASLSMQIQEFEEAIDILQEAIAIEPNFVGGYQLLGDIFSLLHRDQEAEQAYRQADHILKQHNAEEQHTAYARALLRSNK